MYDRKFCSCHRWNIYKHNRPETFTVIRAFSYANMLIYHLSGAWKSNANVFLLTGCRGNFCFCHFFLWCDFGCHEMYVINQRHQRNYPIASTWDFSVFYLFSIPRTRWERVNCYDKNNGNLRSDVYVSGRFFFWTIFHVMLPLYAVICSPSHRLPPIKTSCGKI